MRRPVSNPRTPGTAHPTRSSRPVIIAIIAAASLGTIPNARAEEATGADPFSLPANPEPGRTYRLRLESANRAVRLVVFNASRVAGYGALRPPPGRSLLVLSTEWENVIPLTLVKTHKLATTYKVPSLADHLYLVADGRRLLRLDPAAGKLPGHVPTADLTIEKLGDRLRGNVVFEVGDGPIGSLELRYYDFAHGHIAIPLALPAAPAQPLAPPQKNEVVSAAVYGVEAATERNGIQAPKDLKLVAIDLRAVSQFAADVDATAFDPKARPGQKMKLGTVADWKESRKYLQLVVDGEYARGVTETELPEEPRFLPDVFTGGVVVFLVPEKYASLELRCDFPNARLPDGRLLRPSGLTLPIEGKRPPLPQRNAIASVKDAVFEVSIIGQAVVDDFWGAAPADGKKFYGIDVTVKNIGRQSEFFQGLEQLKHVDEKGEASSPDRATFSGNYRPMELLYIPQGERRSFQLAYQIAAGETRPRLSYAAVTAGASKVLELPKLPTE